MVEKPLNPMGKLDKTKIKIEEKLTLVEKVNILWEIFRNETN